MENKNKKSIADFLTDDECFVLFFFSLIFFSWLGKTPVRFCSAYDVRSIRVLQTTNQKETYSGGNIYPGIRYNHHHYNLTP
jgi:hypothetical protein